MQGGFVWQRISWELEGTSWDVAWTVAFLGVGGITMDNGGEPLAIDGGLATTTSLSMRNFLADT